MRQAPSIFTPHSYQGEAIDFALVRLIVEQQKGAGIFLDPGLGKTSITLSIMEVLKRRGELNRTLIVAPLRAIYKVWPDEIRKWRFPFHWSIVHGGGVTGRRRALAEPAEVFLINPEGLDWLASEYRLPAFDLIVCDESTLFKNWTAIRTKALRRMLPGIPRRLALTGTPSPNGYADLFSQLFIVDDGEALGPNVTYFREWACRDTGRGTQSNWEVTPLGAKEIERRIADRCLYMKAEDHLDMPELVDNLVWVDLPAKVAAAYRQLEKEMFAELDCGATLIASTAGSKYGLCRGMANGGGYEAGETGSKKDRRSLFVHDEKIAAAAEIVDELSGKPALIAYLYDHDAERLARVFPDAPQIRGRTPAKRINEIIDEWNAGKHHVVLVQPQSLSHAANMQAGGNDLIFVGVPDSLELYLQLVRRIYRQGVSGQVRVHHILASDTVDVAVWNRLQSKDESQTALLASLKKYRQERADNDPA